MEVIKELLEPNARFRIDNILYKISEETSQKGDLVIDLKDCTFGRYTNFHCKFGNIIVIKYNNVLKSVEPKFIRKLVICTSELPKDLN